MTEIIEKIGRFKVTIDTQISRSGSINFSKELQELIDND